jgi:hypothetical protein
VRLLGSIWNADLIPNQPMSICVDLEQAEETRGGSELPCVGVVRFLWQIEGISCRVEALEDPWGFGEGHEAISLNH